MTSGIAKILCAEVRLILLRSLQRILGDIYDSLEFSYSETASLVESLAMSVCLSVRLHTLLHAENKSERGRYDRYNV